MLGYWGWGIATSLALNGAVSETLFLDPSFCGEMFVTKASRDWLVYMEKNVARMKEARKGQAPKS